MTSDRGLECVSRIWKLVEGTGIYPGQIKRVVVTLIPKAEGAALRPIGILSALYRVAMTCRRAHLAAFDAKLERPLFAADAGRGPISLVWRQAVEAEAAIASGVATGGFIWDLEKMYDNIGHVRAIREARRYGMPNALIRASMSAYRQARFVQLGKAVGHGTFGRRGVIAGCALATTWAKVVLVTGFDDLWDRYKDQGVDIGVYVDDIAVAVTADKLGTLVGIVGSVARELRLFIECELQGRIARDKAATFGSSEAIVRAIQDEIGCERGGAGPVALGVDVSAGRARGRLRRKAKARSNDVKRRLQRYRRIARVARAGRAVKVFTCGLRPAASYGCEIYGVCNAELNMLRRAAAAAMRPRARGRSLRHAAILYGDPAARDTTAAFERFAAEAWKASGRGQGCVSLGWLQRVWTHARKRARQATWKSARGPIATAHLELRRIRWEWKTPFEVTDDRGYALRLLDVSPLELKGALRLAWGRQLARDLGGKDSVGRQCQLLATPILKFVRAAVSALTRRDWPGPSSAMRSGPSSGYVRRGTQSREDATSVAPQATTSSIGCGIASMPKPSLPETSSKLTGSRRERETRGLAAHCTRMQGLRIAGKLCLGCRSTAASSFRSTTKPGDQGLRSTRRTNGSRRLRAKETFTPTVRASPVLFQSSWSLGGEPW